MKLTNLLICFAAKLRLHKSLCCKLNRSRGLISLSCDELGLLFPCCLLPNRNVPIVFVRLRTLAFIVKRIRATTAIPKQAVRISSQLNWSYSSLQHASVRITLLQTWGNLCMSYAWVTVLGRISDWKAESPDQFLMKKASYFCQVCI